MGCNKAYYLNPDDHPLGSIINIAIGKIASTEVNVDEALQTGKNQIEHSKLGDPKHSTAIFPDKWKHTKRSSQLETLLWLIRKLSMLWLIGLFISNRSLDFNAILASELSAYPPLMFDPTRQSIHLRNPFKLRYQRQPSSKMPQSLMAQLCFRP